MLTGASASTTGRWAARADATDSIRLGYRDEVVTFEFAALDYAAPERNRYAYKLEGFDPDWVPSRQLRRVTYTNLDAGNYRFRVNGANNDGLWNEAGLAIPVHVEAPPWATLVGLRRLRAAVRGRSCSGVARSQSARSTVRPSTRACWRTGSRSGRSSCERQLDLEKPTTSWPRPASPTR